MMRIGQKVLLIVAILLCGICIAKAEVLSGTCGEKISWTLDTKSGVLDVTGTGAMTNWTDESSPFYGNVLIKSIRVSEGVTSIGSRAFLGCGVKSVTIPKSLREIGKGAFFNCGVREVYNLSALQITAGSMDFDMLAYGAVVHTSLDEPSIFENIDGFVFMNVSTPQLMYYTGSETNISLPKDYKGQNYEIANNAFYKCGEITSVSIPNSVTSIGNNAFYGCEGLTSVSIPNSVTSIGAYAFSGCYGLKKAEFASVESLCKMSFTNMFSNPLECAGNLYINGKRVSDLVIPDGVTSIAGYAFYGSFITSVTIPKSVTKINGWAFNCSKLYEVYNLSPIYITKGSVSNGYVAANAKVVHKSLDEPSIYDDIDGCRFMVDTPQLIDYIGSETNITLPKDYKGQNYEIANQAFCKRGDIISVSIPESVTSIGYTAFSGCSGLSFVSIPNSVTSLGYSAFSGCNLISLCLGKNLKTVEGSLCKVNKSIVCLGATPPASSSELFTEDIYANTQLFVPAESLQLYKSAASWKNFQNIVGFSGEPFVKGDADGDGNMTKKDANMVLQHFIGKDTNIEPIAADVNNDGKVSIQDVNIVVNSVLGRK